MTTQTTTVRLAGRTYPIREYLRAQGWTWQPQYQSWTREIVAPGTWDFGAVKAIGANQQGCILVAEDGTTAAVVWRSRTATTVRMTQYVSAGYTLGHDDL